MPKAMDDEYVLHKGWPYVERHPQEYSKNFGDSAAI
jgi:hypothetical protein